MPDGIVTVEWRIERAGGENRIEIKWTESGGPAVSEPSHRGFGMTMIKRGLQQDMAADVEVTFAPTGVTAVITAPLHAGSQTETAAYGVENF